MEAHVTPSSNAFTTLAESLTSDRLIASALAIEAQRSTDTDALLERDAGFAIPGLATTAMMAHAAHVARAEGRFSFDRLERGDLVPAPSWVPVGMSADDFTATLVGDRLESPTCWPFRQDAPLGDFGATDGPKWWTHGQVHALVGGAYWPEMSEWELMHMARLSEAVASWHWYWLSELDRRYCDIHTVTSADQTPDCDRCRELEAAAGTTQAREERLRDTHAKATADNGLAFLRYEGHCYDRGLSRGELIVPEAPYLSMGEACDYARRHRERLVSPAHRRWLSACLVPGEDYATSVGAFSSRAARVVQALVTPMAPPRSVSALRGRRVLQDLGARVCHAAALAGSPHGGFEVGLTAIADGLTALGSLEDEAAIEAAIGDALEGAVGDLQSVPELAERVCALGYRPTTDPESEPLPMRKARGAALLRRARAVGSPASELLAARETLRHAIIHMPRSASVVQDAARAAEARAANSTEDNLVSAFAGWLALASQHWGPEHAAPHGDAQWYYRLALRELPPEANWDQVRLRPNPYLTTLPCPFSTQWLDDLLAGRCSTSRASAPRAARGVGYALMGQGRDHPLLLAWTPEREGLMNRLQHTPTVRELIQAGVPQEAIAAALHEELVIALQQRNSATLEVEAAEGIGASVEDVAIGAQQEEPGPWQGAEQAAYYEAYCQRSALYTDLAEALMDAAEIGAAHHIADLGCGTGVSTLAALRRLGAEGRLLALDPAPRMLAIAESNVRDPRVRFEAGTARRMLQLGGPLDRVLCSSAIWLDPNILVPWKAAQLILRPGGRLCFSIPAEFLGHHTHWETESGEALASAIQVVRAELSGRGSHESVITPTPHADYLGDVARMRAVLLEMGYAEVHVSLYRRPWPVSGYLDWLAQPVSLATVCPGSKATQDAFLSGVRERVEPEACFEARWYLVVAKT